ncbi:putative acetyltransferase [Pseudokineococcus lusitanus]|uniref:Putative acetyltransferase n=1 Tax=Pseudokineococcus lusitanus TaxID=763993 RepID=A0A3N1GX97_9ACTN|nr:putative acetyltransferase [Pseudokineococcus lusitanus]
MGSVVGVTTTAGATAGTAAGVEVRDLRQEEATEWARLCSRGFLETRAPTEAAGDLRWRRTEGHRRRVGVDGGRLIASFRSYGVDLPVPGGHLPADAISSVVVAASHRRQGLLRRLMTEDLRAAKDRGDALAVLIASEAPIYGRYGFGTATTACRWELDVREARFRGDPVRDGAVVLDHVSDADLVDVAPRLFARVHATAAGEHPRDGLWWPMALGLVEDPDADAREQRPAVVAREPGGDVVGLLRYRAGGDLSGGDRRRAAQVRVLDLLAATPAATAALWRAAAEVDLAASVVADHRPTTDPLPLLLADARAAVRSHDADFVWARVLDVPAALEGRRYAATGGLVLEVVDPLGLAGGRWRLDVTADDAGTGAAEVTATTAEPDVVVGVDVLGTVVLGQGSPAPALAAGLVDERTPGAAARLGTLLAHPSSAVLTRTWF